MFVRTSVDSLLQIVIDDDVYGYGWYEREQREHQTL